MYREERVRAALAGKEVDRVPVAAWMHLSAFDQDPISLAEAEVDLTEKYDFDYILYQDDDEAMYKNPYGI